MWTLYHYKFYLFLAVVVAAYYIMPLRLRWLVLLAGSMAYFFLSGRSLRSLSVFLLIIAMTWILGLLQDAVRTEGRIGMRGRKLLLAVSIGLTLFPMIVGRSDGLLYAAEELLHLGHKGFLVTTGLSFFTMQIIAYLVDIYRGKIRAQRNPLKYALFISFFPQILQGPIPRYDQLEPQLVTGHRFDERGFVKGFMRILWGFFLKLMIADKAGLIVNVIFSDPYYYTGAFVLVGGVLYSIQLYADFLACVTLAQGAAELFGIQLTDNFRHPYLAESVKDFWGRWHLSLSTWLRDYIYIPLGGNRRGKVRRYVNLVITFAVSGLWHGVGVKYCVWGLMHAGYQIAGELTMGVRNRIFAHLQFPQNGRARRWIRRGTTFTLVTCAWIIFRADTLMEGVYMLRSLFTTFNPWILLNDSLLGLGLDWKDWMVLLISICVLIKVSLLQESSCLRDRILAQPMILRWGLYIAAVLVIMIFGTYGYGFEAADFIYGGF